MKFTIIAIIVLTIASVAFEFYMKKKETEVYNNLAKLIVTKNYKKFDEIIDLKETKKYFAKFNHLFLKLNKEMLVGNEKKIEDLIKQLDATKLNSKQKEAYYSKAFYYNVAKADTEMATKYHDLYMANCKSGREEIDRAYDTSIVKGYKYLEATLNQLTNANDTEKIQLYSLISSMYENKGDAEKAEEYLNKLKATIDKISKKK